MAKKSSFFLAVLLIANPFMLLFFQNCSSAPHASKGNSENLTPKHAETTTKEVVFFKYK